MKVCAGAGLLLLLGCLQGCPGPAPAPPGPRVRPSIVTPSPALAELVFALEAGPHLIGASRYCRFPAPVRLLPKIGGMLDPNLEAIDALAPDLVLMQGSSEALSALAQRRSFRVVTLEIETLEHIFAALGRLGTLLQRPQAARREVSRLRAALEEASQRAPRPAPRTLLVLGHRPGDLGQLSSPGSGTFLVQCLRAAGGEPILQGLPPLGYHLVGKEALLEEAPELIIELSPEAIDRETAHALRADWRVLDSLPALRAGRIAIVSGEEVLIPGPRLDLLVAKLSRALHGELDVQ